MHLCTHAHTHAHTLYILACFQLQHNNYYLAVALLARLVQRRRKLFSTGGHCTLSGHNFYGEKSNSYGGTPKTGGAQAPLAPLVPTPMDWWTGANAPRQGGDTPLYRVQLSSSTGQNTSQRSTWNILYSQRSTNYISLIKLSGQKSSKSVFSSKIYL